MSIIRFSCVKDELYAPDTLGNIIQANYSSQRENGYLGKFVPEVLVQTSTAPLKKYLSARLETEAARLTDQSPITIMIHGFLFNPQTVVWQKPEDNDNPHGRLFHFEEHPLPVEIKEHSTGWPVRLGFKEDDQGENGLVIAFGWYSSPGLASSLIDGYKSHYSRAYEYAQTSSWALINILHQLSQHDQTKGRPISIFCHSLGSRVIIRSLATMAGSERINDIYRGVIKSIGQVIILGGSEYVVEAQLMHSRLYELDNRPHFYNIVSRENNVLDVLGENFGPLTFGNTKVIGHKGIDTLQSDIWVDIAIDSSEMRSWLKANRDHDISGDQPGTIWDHWYYYTYPGNMQFYSDLLRDPKKYSIPELKSDESFPDGVWF